MEEINNNEMAICESTTVVPSEVIVDGYPAEDRRDFSFGDVFCAWKDSISLAKTELSIEKKETDAAVNASKSHTKAQEVRIEVLREELTRKDLTPQQRDKYIQLIGEATSKLENESAETKRFVENSSHRNLHLRQATDPPFGGIPGEVPGAL